METEMIVSKLPKKLLPVVERIDRYIDAFVEAKHTRPCRVSLYRKDLADIAKHHPSGAVIFRKGVKLEACDQ